MLKILVACDGSDHSRMAARMVGRLVREMPGARVTLVHVMHPTHPAGHDIFGHEIVPDVPVDVMLRRAAEPAFQQAREEMGLAGDKVDSEVMVGEPAEEIIALARARQFDMVVVGSRGRSALTEALMGSVSQAVMHRAPCPVLVVR